MPGFIGSQSNNDYWIGVIRQMQNDIDALKIQIQFLAGGGAFNLPTSNPHVVGRLWNNSGTVDVSAG